MRTPRSATPSPTMKLPPPGAVRGCAPWARSTRATDERVHADHGRAGGRATTRGHRPDLSALETASGRGDGGQGWRHGVMRYRGGEAGFYRLSSLRWWPDRRLSRRGLEIVSRRSPRGDEFDIMT